MDTPFDSQHQACPQKSQQDREQVSNTSVRRIIYNNIATIL